MDNQVTVAIISAVVGLITAFLINGVGWFLLRSQREKTDAEAADVLTGAALRIVQALEGKVEKLEGIVENLERQLEIQRGALRTMTELNVELLRGTYVLSEQIVNLGEEPCWTVVKLAGDDDALSQELQRLQGELD
jgi:hypothetical protein